MARTGGIKTAEWINRVGMLAPANSFLRDVSAVTVAVPRPHNPEFPPEVEEVVRRD